MTTTHPTPWSLLRHPQVTDLYDAHAVWIGHFRSPGVAERVVRAVNAAERVAPPEYFTFDGGDQFTYPAAVGLCKASIQDSSLAEVLKDRIRKNRNPVRVITAPAQLARIITQVTFWGLLVGSVAISHLYLGGPLTLDLAALLLVFVSVVNVSRWALHYDAEMTWEEAKLFFAVDPPVPPHEWLALHRSRLR